MWKWKPKSGGAQSKRRGHLPPSRRVRPSGLAQLELLDRRVLPAVTATFSAAQGLLTITGDASDNALAVSRNAAGSILVNGGAVAVRGGTPTVANTRLVQVFGLAGNDTLSLNEANGALPKANIFGGAGNDTITGGSGNDQLFGEAGDDTVLGKGGDDLLFGGAGNDVLTAGVGNDQVFGQAGDDRLIWNPGDGSALNEGGAGSDTIEVNGGNVGENLTVTANGSRVRFDRVSPAPFFLDIGTSENLVVNANGGDDAITAGNGLATLIQVTENGGAGNDTLTGGDGNDLINGGDGNDVVNGGRGNDRAFLGAGDDTFVWNPGDGSDTVEGQDGNDAMVFNGANIDEQVNIAANGSRVRFTRDVAGITMDLNGVEGIDFNALGGVDLVTVGDLSGTGVTAVNLDLSGVAGSGAGDGAADSVVVKGSDSADAIGLIGAGSSFRVAGLQADVVVNGSEGANDSLEVDALGGSDSVDATVLPAGLVKQLTIDGGTGNDSIFGGAGNDMLLGGDGNDFVDGGRGSDTAILGAGDDTFRWDPGDGSDTVEGQGGRDTLRFNGSDDSEQFDVSANGGRARLTRDRGGVVMDLDDVESINLNALGGADTVNVNDLTSTDVTQLNLSLAGSTGPGPGDGQADHVVLNGTNGDDAVQIASFDYGARIAVGGLFPFVNITGAEGANDTLTVNTLGGNDGVDAANLSAGLIGLALNGGAGNDSLVASPGNDLVNGGAGNDVAMLGAGDDTFVWNPGDGSDTVEGQSGSDTMVFNGANIDEQFDVSANGPRVRVSRNVGTVVMDLNGVEAVDLNALGGADLVTVNDLTGTDLAELNLDLGSPPASGTGDGAADSVVVNGTNGNDAVTIAGDAGGVEVSGLSALVTIQGADAARDRLTVKALGGDDVVAASGLSVGAIALTADGGEGDDLLLGGDGNDTLIGGEGDDILNGGPGLDVLDGGPGDNVLFQD